MWEAKLEPDVTISCNAGISACEKGEQWRRALALLGEMRGAQLELDSVSCDAVLLALERGEAGIRMRRLLQAPPPGAERACAGGTLRRAPSRLGLSGAGGLHFCIFQGGEQGVEGWTLDRGSFVNRWDALLDGLLQCVMMDGEWPHEVRASAFVGRDSVHLGGQVQDWVMPVVGQRDGGAAAFQPVTLPAWEDVLWWARGEAGLPDLEWRLAREAPGSLEATRRQQLESLREELARLPEAAAVFLFTPARPDVSYDRLVELGEGRSPRSGGVYVLMGGAHGFDDSDDCDSCFAAEVFAAFSARFGDDRVLRVSLGADELPVGGPEPKFTLASVASFVSVEYTRGALQQAVAGVEAYCHKKTSTYNSGISACENGEQWQRALSLLGEMWEAKLELDAVSYSVGITAVIKLKRERLAAFGSKANPEWGLKMGVKMGSPEWNSLADPSYTGSMDTGHKEGMQTFGEVEKGMQDEAEYGVLALLEVVQSDFANLEASTKAAEAESQKAYDEFMIASKKDKAKKDRKVEMNTADKNSAESQMQQDIADLKATQDDELIAAQAFYDRLVPQCFDKGMTFKERTEARESEIASLKEALKILDSEDIA
ncbi:unnamed protein product [Prorocentrum cordatum]|uniref:Uncharacterized protein n=1 Tax=Prorocentrum cordatum TaxID=2364126 RepID=A0ABN9QW72_9DINO|nr:unnamed protein product [Polarella glacialis]